PRSIDGYPRPWKEAECPYTVARTRRAPTTSGATAARSTTTNPATSRAGRTPKRKPSARAALPAPQATRGDNRHRAAVASPRERGRLVGDPDRSRQPGHLRRTDGSVREPWPGRRLLLPEVQARSRRGVLQVPPRRTSRSTAHPDE